MSTEAAVSSTTSTQSAPQIPSGDGDEFSPEEKAYFESRGATAPAPASDFGTQQPKSGTQPSDLALNEPSDDDEIDGEVQLDGNGNGRDPKTGRFVPKGQFLRVREQAKTSKAEAQRYRDELIAARERVAILTEVAAPPTSQQGTKDAVAELASAEDIDPEVDVFGALKQAQARTAMLQRAMQQNANQTKQMQTSTAFQEDVKRFMAEAPDWTDAFQFIAARRDALIKVLDPDLSDAERRAQIADEAKHVLERAINSRKSPAKAFYDIAKEMGYSPKATQQQNPLAAAAQQVAQIEANKAAGASLRGAGGGGVGETLSRAQLADMDEVSYTRARSDYIGRYGNDAWTRLMRGG